MRVGNAELLGSRLLAGRPEPRYKPQRIGLRYYRCRKCGATFPYPKYVTVERKPPKYLPLKYYYYKVKCLVPVCPYCGSKYIEVIEE